MPNLFIKYYLQPEAAKLSIHTVCGNIQLTECATDVLQPSIVFQYLAIDLLGTLRDLRGRDLLFTGRVADFAHLNHHFAHRMSDLFNLLYSLARDTDPIFDLFDCAVNITDRSRGLFADSTDHAGYLLRSLCCALGQFAYLISHHREATTLFSGTRGLDRGIKRK